MYVSSVPASQSKLKLFQCLVLGALIAHCAGLKAAAWFTSDVLQKLGCADLPGLTRLVLGLSRYVFLLPLPWAAYSAMRMFRNDNTTEACLIYAATALLLIVVTFWIALLGFAMPLSWLNHSERAALTF
jgi:hypothetical protein